MFRYGWIVVLICAMVPGPAEAASTDGASAFWRSLHSYGGSGQPCTRLCVMSKSNPTQALNAPFLGGSLRVDLLRHEIRVAFFDEHGAPATAPDITSARVQFHLRDGRILGAPLFAAGPSKGGGRGDLSAHLETAAFLAEVCVVHVRLDRGPVSTTVTAVLHPLCAHEGTPPCCAP